MILHCQSKTGLNCFYCSNFVNGVPILVIFTARRSYAGAVLGVVILSVPPPVWRLSHACFVTNPKNLPAIFLYHMKGQPSSFLPPNSGWWATSPSTFNRRSKWPTRFKNRSRGQISACNVSTVRAIEKRSIMTNRKSYTGFPTSYRWSAYVTSKSPNGWLKKRTFPFLE